MNKQCAETQQKAMFKIFGDATFAPRTGLKAPLLKR